MRSFFTPTLGIREAGRLATLAGLVAFLCLLISPSLLHATQVRVREGQEVRLLLRDVLTTENVQKEDTINFNVADDVVVNGHTVIAKGAPATGKVVRVKGAGKKRAKDASVTFRLVSVRTVDNQQVELRKNRSRDKKKGNSKADDFEEDQPIAGQLERIVGAEKGKLYIAFLDQPSTINASDSQPAPPSTSAATPTQTGTSAAATLPPSPILAPEPASVDFVSDPSGADIVIDGNFVGNTPSTLQLLPGRHSVEMRMSGYRSYKVSMIVDAGSHPRLSKTLEKE